MLRSCVQCCYRKKKKSRDIYIWEETIGADKIKKLGSRIMRIVVYEINVEISH